MKPDAADAAYMVDCPLCHAVKGERCTYMPNSSSLNYPRRPNPKWGQPTLRPHNDRLFKARERQYRRAREELRKQRVALLADPYAAERRALADLMIQEHKQMRIWLRLYGRLFWTEVTTHISSTRDLHRS